MVEFGKTEVKSSAASSPSVSNQRQGVKFGMVAPLVGWSRARTLRAAETHRHWAARPRRWAGRPIAEGMGPARGWAHARHARILSARLDARPALRGRLDPRRTALAPTAHEPPQAPPALRTRGCARR